MGAVLSTIRYLEALLLPTHSMTVPTSQPAVTTKTVSRHYQLFPGDEITPFENHWSITARVVFLKYSLDYVFTLLFKLFL